MANISIFVTDVTKQGAGIELSDPANFLIIGRAWVSGTSSVEEIVNFDLEVAHNSPAVVVNRAIKAAAILAVQAPFGPYPNGISVSTSDNKILFGGAQDI